MSKTNKNSLFIITFFCLTLLSTVTFAQSKVLESLSFKSDILQTDVRYSVYLPHGYDHSERLYPVVYLLNGFTGDERDWIQFGDVQRLVDNEVASGNLPEMIIIMPDGDDRLYMNHADGSYNYQDMFMQELIPTAENDYRIRKEKQFRGISGLSMGGHGSLLLGLKYPKMFGAIAAYSSAVATDEDLVNIEQRGFDNYWGRGIGRGLTGEERLTPHHHANSVMSIVKNKNIDELNSVRIYFDCGDDDFLAVGNASLHIAMSRRGINHEYRVRDGVHDWKFWRASLPTGLKFIAQNFTR
mgnify:CR=1 FL=1